VAVSVADVVNVAPEFVSLGSPEVTTAISDAALEVSAAIWGTRVDVGVKWLAAHKLARSHPELAQYTPKVWETAGAQDAGELGTTRFGMEYRRMLRTLDARVFGA
jgi:hypothetical protein